MDNGYWVGGLKTYSKRIVELRPGAHSPILADLVVGSNKCQSDTEAINDFRGMENSWAVPTHLMQSEGVANDFPLESERKLDVFEYVATNRAVHTYDNSCSYNRYYGMES
ncbi:hypothetical protein AVEN_7874-1 [Araneus ventricosus]|uniref:Uncharacterized protein n=1 Tax=Araneus ventricosus TaxID=182803 RepID=A0A4Y2JQ20_ARAVE|nr:hypothetical protein AVEN_7874-1 [Araneus ventricosus]